MEKKREGATKEKAQVHDSIPLPVIFEYELVAGWDGTTNKSFERFLTEGMGHGTIAAGSSGGSY